MSRFSLSRVSGAPASDEDLLADLRRVAQSISKSTVTQKQYRQLGKYHDTTLGNRFGSWNKANVAAGLTIYDKSTSSEFILADLRRVAVAVSQSTVSIEQYRQLGKHDRFTVTNRFGSWKKALTAAGLGISKNAGISDEILFENILRVWQHYGRQPRRSELTSYPSTISQGPYWRRFGSWTSALERFVEFANAAEAVPNNPTEDSVAQAAALKTDPTLKTQCATPDFPPRPSVSSVSIASTPTRRSPRDPGLRLRFKVLQRDNFSCRNCGRSPAIVLGVILHVDHKLPWSKGGETVFENLVTLCQECNLGKSDLVSD